MDKDVTLKCIGTIHSEFKNLENMPVQPVGNSASKGRIELDSKFIEGLKDLEEFSHIIIIYHFHKAEQIKLTVKPFLDNDTHGVFATRSPLRPSHIGLSVVEIDKIKENIIFVKNIDVLDGTPVLDIKPFVPEFDNPKSDIRIGWFTSNVQNAATRLSDNRFIK